MESRRTYEKYGIILGPKLQRGERLDRL